MLLLVLYQSQSQRARKHLRLRLRRRHRLPPLMTKTKAEELKTKGNAAMSQKSYQEAIDHYSSAIEIDPQNARLFRKQSSCSFAKG